MKADEILDNLASSREHLLLTLEPLPNKAMIEGGVMGDWSIADILAHLIAWESELITCLKDLDQGKKPSRMLAAIADVDGYNARRFAENKGRNLDRIFDDLHGARIQLEEWISHFSDSDLNDRKKYKWNDDIPLWQIIEANSFGHEEEHLPEIVAFAQRWLSSNSQGADG